MKYVYVNINIIGYCKIQEIIDVKLLSDNV